MLLISGLCDYFTLFHYFTLKSKVWVAYPFCMGYWRLAIGYGRLEKRKKSAKVLNETDKTCQFERKF